MLISNRGLAFIAREEACVLVGFLDRTNWAIGFSHHGAEVGDGSVMTIAQAVKTMQADCHVCDIVLGRAIKVPLPPTCWDALISLAYNIGSGAIARSELVAAINRGNLSTAAILFSTYENPGRRDRERSLFLTGIYAPTVNGVPLGSMQLFTSNPHATPRPVPELVPFPLPIDEVSQ